MDIRYYPLNKNTFTTSGRFMSINHRKCFSLSMLRCEWCDNNTTVQYNSTITILKNARFTNKYETCLFSFIFLATSTHLSGRLNLGQIRESYLRDMLSILDSIEGSKCLVRDDELTGPSSTIVEMQVLKVRVLPTKCTKSRRKNQMVYDYTENELNRLLLRLSAGLITG